MAEREDRIDHRRASDSNARPRGASALRPSRPWGWRSGGWRPGVSALALGLALATWSSGGPALADVEAVPDRAVAASGTAALRAGAALVQPARGVAPLRRAPLRLRLAARPPVDGVLVEKAQRRLHLLFAGQIVRTYTVALGGNPRGHKQREGDRRTPEGRYVLDWRNEDSAFYRSIHISYPSPADVRAARERGVSPGGSIMIHGLPNGLDEIGRGHLGGDWTDGCIAVTNAEIDEILRLVEDGTPIEIRP